MIKVDKARLVFGHPEAKGRWTIFVTFLPKKYKGFGFEDDNLARLLMIAGNRVTEILCEERN